MTMAGWIFMLASLGFVVILTAFCFIRVLSKPASVEHMHAPLEIDTHDVDT